MRHELARHEKLFRTRGEFGPLLASGVGPLSRRDFLRLAGFAVAASSVAGCRRAPVQHALPYLNQPEGVVAGRPAYYASVCGGCNAGCGLLVKTRDGRPIKLEGNPEHPLSRGGLCAVGQASLLGLYDSHRLTGPLRSNKEVKWDEVDTMIRTRLADLAKQGKAACFLTGPILSPTTRTLLRSFTDGVPAARHVVLEARLDSSIPEAHSRTHGARVQPSYHFEKAAVVVSFGADFLGTWISPVEFTAGYRAVREAQDAESARGCHVQFESSLSLTGSKADQRFVIHPDEFGAVLSHLAIRLAGKAGVAPPGAAAGDPPVPGSQLDKLVDLLWESRGKSLVLCGSEDVNLQILTNYLNYLSGNYDSTIVLARPMHQLQSKDTELAELLRDVKGGKVGALFVHACNPVHDLPDGAALADAIRGLPLAVAISERLDETAKQAEFVCPVPHPLESWSDSEPVNGIVSIAQPAIDPLGNTRPFLESLAAWTSTRASAQPASAYDLIRAHWKKEIFPRHGATGSFDAFWNQTVHDGVARIRPAPIKIETFRSESVRLAFDNRPRKEDSFTLLLYSKVGMPDSSHAYNPWLHELPDPLTKVTWDNYACISPQAAVRLAVNDGDIVRLECDGPNAPKCTLELPVLVQPGQHDQVVAVALGYGSVLSERFAKVGPPWIDARPSVGDNGQVGANAAEFLNLKEGRFHRQRRDVRIAKTDKRRPLARTQDYQRLDPPPDLRMQPGAEVAIAGPEIAPEKADQDRKALPLVDGDPGLWPDDHPSAGPRWGMTIDQNACTGCSACVIACQAENNIPVVGRDEVRRHREMHWLRIDRYYLNPTDDVRVIHQPMLCQHCGNAPCEPVCPVLATVHSDEGLNQQVYNRCVGTRYCANNCPYKVRRFNWFDYAHDDVLQNLALNPEVTVRSRGVMEKCTFCVQRIQDAKSRAGHSDSLADGDVQTACQQSCPAKAITFGNLNDPQSRVARMAKASRAYSVLAELNVRPSIRYLPPQWYPPA